VILVEIRPRGGTKQTIEVHPGVTVLGGLDGAARRTWATDLARALQGETAASLDLEVELDGRRQTLSPELVRSLGLGEASTAVTVFAVDLPGAVVVEARPPAPAPATAVAAPTDDLTALEAEVAGQDARVQRLTAALAEAERAATSAADEVTTAGRHGDREAAADLRAAEERLEAARAAAASAREQLAAAEEVARADADAESARTDEVRSRVDDLQRELATLEAERAEIVARMVEAGDPGDPAPVEQALAGLRRLKSVKPKPSAKAVDLADRWVEAGEKLAALPQPPQPPEWLVTPALAALQEAREALTEAESGARPIAVDPEKIEALDRAHRDVLDAEQRAMKKGSRLNRRRLDAAHESEQAALSALGVSSYGEYLQRIAPALEPAGSGEDRVAAARAALADAEAVWEELHGGQASPEWTAAKEHQASVRTEALAMLGADVDDDAIEERLRNHLEAVVDTEWAETALITALRQAGAPVSGGGDLEAEAERWLADAPALSEARRALEQELSDLDGRLSATEEQLAEQRADAFFADDGTGTPPAPAPATTGPLAALRRALHEAESAESDAQAAVAAARERVAANEAQQSHRAELEAAADARRADVDRLKGELRDAEAALASTRERVRAASTDRAKPAPPAKGRAAADGAVGGSGVDLSAVVGMEAEAYLLARVAALRGAAGGPLPLVLDGDAVAGLSDGAARRVFRLLGRLAGSMQVVVLGDDESIATWAEGLGDQAAVRHVAR
jgi:hypothetical protein